MSVDGKSPISIDRARQPKAQEVDPNIVFRVVVYADGTMDWKTQHTGDPLTDELLARGWFDKVRETVLEAMMRPPDRIVT